MVHRGYCLLLSLSMLLMVRYWWVGMKMGCTEAFTTPLIRLRCFLHYLLVCARELPVLGFPPACEKKTSCMLTLVSVVISNSVGAVKFSFSLSELQRTNVKLHLLKLNRF